MSFMAVAYVPAYIEDRATFVKERANGLYGATPFMVANFLIGLPFLCTYRTCLTHRLPQLSKIVSLTNQLYSPHLHALLNCLILALQLPPRRIRLHDLGNVDVPRPRRRRKSRRFRHVYLPQFRHLARTSRLREWSVDERRRIPGYTDHPESILEICLPLYRLSGTNNPPPPTQSRQS